MPKHQIDEEREERIETEVLVDTYNDEEAVAGWSCYLGEKLSFPFQARCIKESQRSPLKLGETVQVLGMINDDECLTDMAVEVAWAGRTCGVPLSHLQGIDVDEQTAEAIADWQYWLASGNRL
ncbi:calcium-binding protein [Lamprobacter modestohalophilus]|uniref:Calcium-binding protein n=1 Tax=Lamprobacter modestohalophilus TaxID=1064514 RepID=A0A9X1B5A0_9GAMM|nr:calcium-binding protein [Lamprobacter modestohalophilus]MBK1619591.1 calcium-binding protein [Lamprobacter modestohalophilus]